MNQDIREAQIKILNIFSKYTKSFSLSGGSALELFYLHHRFSRDLDFFSTRYNSEEIDYLVSKFQEGLASRIKLENEIVMNSKAKVRFYTMPVKKTSDTLKIDFVEDVLNKNPSIRKFNKIPVYDVNEIYFQKIITITGTGLFEDATGKHGISGRNEIRDIIDLYYLSKKVQPLHKFLKSISREYQRGIVRWYRTYSRMEFKLGYLDFDVYDRELNSKDIILHLDNEVKKFISEELK